MLNCCAARRDRILTIVVACDRHFDYEVGCAATYNLAIVQQRAGIIGGQQVNDRLVIMAVPCGGVKSYLGGEAVREPLCAVRD